MALEQQNHWGAAMLHMRLALELLDVTEAPAHVGARLDHAIHDLQEELRQATATGLLPQPE